MKIGILASENSWYFRDLERAAHVANHECQRLDFSRLVATVSEHSTGFQQPVADQNGELRSTAFPINDLDLILVRTMPPGSLEQVVFRMDLLARLDAAGTRIINSPKSLECAVDKFLTTSRLQAACLPVPATIVCEHEDDALDAFQKLGGDVVVKPLFGSEGRGIVRVTDPDLAHRTFRTLMRLNCVLYLQKYIDHRGFDVRVLVLDGKVIGAMRRRSEVDFRTNVSRNAIAEPYEATEIEKQFAIRAAETTGAFIAGVDLLHDRDGHCYVIEVNAVPGWQAFRRVTGIDVASRLIEKLSRELPTR